MVKNWITAIALALGLWVVMFIGVSALMVAPLPAIWQKILEIVLSGAASFILARIYFKKNPGELKDGLALGAVWFLVGGVLDLLITVQYVKAGAGYFAGLKTFYGMWNLWVGFLLMFAGVVLAAKMTHGGEIAKMPNQPQPPIMPKV
ncbi:MAG: hypothetical protein WC768_05275 [Patescibacteria group bacterium]|jgi:hypothetical protein